MQLSYCLLRKSKYLTLLFCMIHAGAIGCLLQVSASLLLTLALAALILVHLVWILSHYCLQKTKYALKAIGHEISGDWYLEYNNNDKIYSQIISFIPICGMLIIKFLQGSKPSYCLIGYDQLDSTQYRMLKTNLHYRRTV